MTMGPLKKPPQLLLVLVTICVSERSFFERPCLRFGQTFEFMVQVF
jgi:hypothetical protein